MVRPPMPILTGAVTFARFRSEPAAPRSDGRRWLVRGLKKKAFEPLDPRRSDADRAAGFVELEDHDQAAFDGADLLQGAFALFAWRIDTIKVPGAAVKAEVERWAAAFQAEKGRPPARGEKRRKQDEVKALLRQKTEPRTKVLDVCWELATGELTVWAASRKVVDEIAVALEEAFGVKLHPRSVSAVAVERELPESALGPTAALLGIGEGKEVLRGEA